jgi:carbon storage regulator
VVWCAQEGHLLTITRKAGQAVLIGDGVRILVKEIRGRQVRLLIEADRKVPVYREELYKQIVAENERAAKGATDLLEHLE